MATMTKKHTEIDFTNTAEAYKTKTLSELKQAEWMFRMLNHKLLGGIGKALLKFAIKVGLPVKPIIKATLYKHFVGGETLEDCVKAINRLAEQNVKSILDYSEEGQESEEGFEHAFQELLRNIKFAGTHAGVAFSVFKVTAFASSALLEKVSAGSTLTEDEKQAWKKVEYRFEKLCDTAYQNNVPIMVDAEESWIQQAIDDLTFAMMRKYNREKVTVLNTYQMYRKDRLEYLIQNFNQALEEGFKIGAKLVRGAYMEKERARAQSMGYNSPIQNTKEDSDKDYNSAVRFCMQHLDNVMVVVATHNEESAKLAAELLDNTAYPKSYHYVWFSQLLGMCDHISFTLAAKGYNVVKYVPYGPVKSVTPYLIRRADENSSVSGQAIKEMALLRKEIQRRKRK